MPSDVSAQPAPSGFESDSVVCSSTNRNNGRTAWDAKDEIIGRRNCQLEGLKGECRISELCNEHGISQRIFRDNEIAHLEEFEKFVVLR